MVDFGPLAAEIVSLVWGTPANFNSFRAYSQPSHTGCLPYFHTWLRGLNANLGCSSEMNCMRLAEIQDAKNSPSAHHRTTLSGHSQLRHVSTIGKNLLNSNTSPTCFYNMVNFGALAAEMVSSVWGTPANFNGFRVLAALLHGTLVVGVSQTLRR